MPPLILAGVLTVFLTLLPPSSMASESVDAPEPAADTEATIVAGNARFTILTPSMIRLEWSAKQQFEDRASLMAINRRLEVPRFTSSMRKGWLIIETDELLLRYHPKKDRFDTENLSIELKAMDSSLVWTPGRTNSGNLGGTVRTLDSVSGSTPLDPGLLSRDGWVLVDDSRTLLLEGDPAWPTPRPDPDAIDWYFFGYGLNYTRALHDYTRLSGNIPLPPRYSFGAWWSRYWDYSADDLKELILAFEEYDVPLDVLVIDMDWHLEGWTGYTWNRDLFPDPQGFLDWVHEKGLHTTLNLHPHDGVRSHENAFPEMARALGLNPGSVDHIPFDIADPSYMKAYFEVLHHPLERQGVDFWWIDWQQGEASKIPGLDPLFWLNHLHWTDMEKRQWETGKRPLIFSRWGGLGSHRYPIGFSGDTFNNWPSLAFQPHFTATAGNVAYPFWSHDIGGHQPGPVDGELYARWIQFGAFNPFLRTHASKHPDAERRIWSFGDEVFLAARAAFRFRYSLIPYIYTSARQAVDHSLPLMRPLYYEWPVLDKAYQHPGQYMFGDHFLVAPVTSPLEPASRCAVSTVWLPPGLWQHWYTGDIVKGPGTIPLMTPLEQMPLFARAGAIIPTTMVEPRIGSDLPETIIFEIVRGDSGAYTLYEDDGISAEYLQRGYSTTKVALQPSPSGCMVTIDSTRGDFTGMPLRRNYRIHLRDTPPPRSVKLDDDTLQRVSAEEHSEGAAWWYDPAQLAVVVDLPDADVKRVSKVHFSGLPENTSLLSGLRGRLNLLREFQSRYGENSPVDAERLLLQQSHLADSTSRPSDALALAQQVQENWGNLATAFTTAKVEESLKREAFLRMHGLSLTWAPELREGVVEAAVELTLLEPIKGLQALVTIPVPERWTAQGNVAEGNVPLIPHQTLRWSRLLTPRSLYGPATLHADVVLQSGEESFRVPFETHLFPSIGAWQVIGPFDNPEQHALDTPFGPESDVDLGHFHIGKGGEQVGWRWVARSAEKNNGLDEEFVVDFQELFGSHTEDAIAYALTWLDAPEAMDAVLALGSDDGVKVWLNGEVVHKNVTARAYTSRADRVPVSLKEGLNILLVKVSQSKGGWAFCAHLEDAEGRQLDEVTVKAMP